MTDAPGLRCRLIEAAQAPGGYTIDRATGLRPQPGDLWRAPWYLETDEPHLSQKYLSLPHPRRDPLVVCCPNGEHFCVDQRAYDHSQGGYHGEGWTVEGEAPELTVTPSIHLVGRWHGFLQKGFLRTA